MKPKIKILHVVGKMHPGGIETLLMNLYRTIDRDKYEFHFAVQFEEKGFYDDEIVELGGRIFRQPHPKKGLRAFRRAFLNNLQEHGPYQAVHSHIYQFSGYVLKLAGEMNVPVRISHSHNTHDSKQESWLRNLYRKYMRGLIRSNSTSMLGCSRSACEALFGADCWRDERVVVFPNSIQVQPYSQLHPDRTDYRRAIGVTDPDVPVIGHIGRFSEQKNHPFLLDAFAGYLRIRPEAQLVLIGDGPLRSRMEDRIRELGISGSVKLLGVRKDIPELIGAFDLFLLPSLYEGLGIVVIEAQAAGVPCLISDQVPEEADLKLGLVSRLPLQADAGEWAAQMGSMTGAARLDWPARLEALQQYGYDIRTSVQRLERMYAAT
ncbi:glycosyltransferase family 1 protein [Paenibacillus lutrae]|uniref:Glycosyltransferase n=1 Tax=Paenibacillus lutrae TaxID=2078573 RepID=A0A7X3JZW8_9BACL|nr:glycosyltransferase family 1 protein [Paenibacillus lutrae]MVP00490.1 glycosyltransferase [Paenibacillus lutrae]